tara:strand:+ start:681 stop:1535 length:855 start_codon:yes stop_codon:yes gene_type:complete
MLKVVRRNKAQIDRLLYQIKLLIIKEGRKMAWDFIMSQVPTEEQVINKMKELAKNNPKEAKKYYDKTLKLLNGIKLKLSSSLIQINKIKDKLQSVNDKVTYITSINNIVSPFITTLQDIELGTETIIITAGASPTTPPGPIAQSAILKNKIKGILKKTFSAIELASRIITITGRTYFSLKRTTDDAYNKITQLISYIDNLISVLEGIFIDILMPLLEDQDNLPVIDSLEDLYSYYPGIEGYLNSDNEDLPSLDSEEGNNTTNGISNTPPRFFKRYRKDPYTEEF